MSPFSFDEAYRLFTWVKRSAEAKKQAAEFLISACDYFQLSSTEYEKIKKINSVVWEFFLYNAQRRKFSPNMIQQWADLIDGSPEDVRKIFISRPEIFAMSCEEALKNIEGIAHKFHSSGLTNEKILKMAVKNPVLFGRNPSSVYQSAQQLLDYFKHEGLTQKKYLKAARKHPQILSLKPQEVIQNIHSYVRFLGVDDKKCIKLALKNPGLFYQETQEAREKLESLSKSFQKEGISYQDLLKASIKNPTLLSSDPATVVSKIQAVVRYFSTDGLTMSSYLKSVLKQPNLFNLKPTTVQGNICTLADKFKNDGLSVGEYLKCALKESGLFYRKPDSSESSIREVVRYFSKDGLTTWEYLNAAKKMPTLFRQASKTTIQHAEKVKKVMLENHLVNTPHEVWQFLCANPIVLSYSEENIDFRDYAISLMHENHQKPALSVMSVQKAKILDKLPTLTGVSKTQINSLLDEEEKHLGKKLSKSERTEKSIGLIARLHHAQLKNENEKDLAKLFMLCGNRTKK